MIKIGDKEYRDDISLIELVGLLERKAEFEELAEEIKKAGEKWGTGEQDDYLPFPYDAQALVESAE